MPKKKSFFEKVEAEVIDETGGYIRNKIKSKIIKYSEVSIFALLSFLLISIGISELLAVYFPVLVGGWNYILLGIVFLLAAVLIRM